MLLSYHKVHGSAGANRNDARRTCGRGRAGDQAQRRVCMGGIGVVSAVALGASQRRQRRAGADAPRSQRGRRGLWRPARYQGRAGLRTCTPSGFCRVSQRTMRYIDSMKGGNGLRSAKLLRRCLKLLPFRAQERRQPPSSAAGSTDSISAARAR